MLEQLLSSRVYLCSDDELEVMGKFDLISVVDGQHRSGQGVREAMAELTNLRIGDCVGLPQERAEEEGSYPCLALFSTLFPSLREVQDRFSRSSQVKQVANTSPHTTSSLPVYISRRLRRVVGF